MICPICKVKNLKSILKDYGSMVTCLYCIPFYDEDGNYHHHDRNNITTGYDCSNGHKFNIVTQKKCPQENCDWNKKLKKEIWFDKDGFSKEEIEQIKDLVSKN
jgi:hypothetical protein